MGNVSRLLVCLCTTVVISTANAALPTHDSSGQPLPSLAPMLNQVNAAVVNIATFSTQQAYNPLLNDPFFRRFFNIPDPRFQQPQKRQQAAGSGVIVDSDEGTVVTNYHVVKGADEVQVSLNDGRTFNAKIVGVDPELDIAVLDIDGDDLTEVKLSDSNKLQVGDFVVAIGNPFGLGQTVTTGVVSALGRTGLGIEGYENFIQTDASINPGNSGGALVNLHGELVGINTAIISPAGGNVGIGFAIPINMAKFSIEQILRYGEVRRGDIGITQVQDITSDLRTAFKLKNGQRGVLITDIQEDSPAEKSGLKQGDIITSVDGQAANSASHLRSLIGTKAIGDDIELSVIRDGRKKSFDVEIADPKKLAALNGKLFQTLEGAQFEENPDGYGVLVSRLAANSPAAYYGLRPGDVITEVNNIQINNVNDFRNALRADGQKIVLRVYRRGAVFYLVIR